MPGYIVDVEIPVVYVRWIVDTKKKSLRTSSSFKFQGSKWNLEYYYTSYNSHTHNHNVRLHYVHASPRSYYSPFDISVNVVSYTGRRRSRIIPRLTKTRTYENGHMINSPWIGVLRDVDLEMLRYPYSDSIEFLVVLKVKDDLLTIPHMDTDSKEIQTDCNVSSCSTMTTLLPNMTPCMESLSEDLTKLMVQDSNLDVEFQCGSQSTKAHSAIVSARSPVIATMLATNMIEGRTKVIKIPNMEPTVFQQFLRYLHSGKLDELAFDTAISLYGIGQQHAVHALAKRCSDFLIDRLSVENACEVLFVADAHSDADFAKVAIDFLVEHEVPSLGGCWPDFCDKHPRLANIVFARCYSKMRLAK